MPEFENSTYDTTEREETEVEDIMVQSSLEYIESIMSLPI
jgi:hypothetical protein